MFQPPYSNFAEHAHHTRRLIVATHVRARESIGGGPGNGAAAVRVTPRYGQTRQMTRPLAPTVCIAGAHDGLREIVLKWIKSKRAPRGIEQGAEKSGSLAARHGCEGLLLISRYWFFTDWEVLSSRFASVTFRMKSPAGRRSSWQFHAMRVKLPHGRMRVCLRT